MKVHPIAHKDGHENNIMAVEFSPDGNYLASGSWDCTIKIWETQAYTHPMRHGN
jgi:WD40 repeat protein